LFGQARAIAEKCTNHHAENVIPQVMLRLQAKQEQHMALLSVEKGDTQVSHVAKQLPHLPGTSVKMSFLKNKEDSWQLHLQRISPFLTAGEGVWWTRTTNGFHFYDGDTDNSQAHGITLFHYRQQSVSDVEERRKTCWRNIIEQRITIPAYAIKVYDQEGKKTGRLLYNAEGGVTHEADFSPDLDMSDVTGPDSEGSTSNYPVRDGPTNSLQNNDASPVTNGLECDGTVGEGCPDGLNALDEQEQLIDEGENPTHCHPTSSPQGVPSPYIHLALAEADEGLRTSLATSIKNLLKDTDGVTEFDELRFKLKKARETKERRSIQDVMIIKYNNLSA
jgi:hypothetical protein